MLNNPRRRFATNSKRALPPSSKGNEARALRVLFLPHLMLRLQGRGRLLPSSKKWRSTWTSGPCKRARCCPLHCNCNPVLFLAMLRAILLACPSPAVARAQARQAFLQNKPVPQHHKRSAVQQLNVAVPGAGEFGGNLQGVSLIHGEGNVFKSAGVTLKPDLNSYMELVQV